MNCTMSNPSCQYDEDGRLKKSIETLAGFDFRKEVILTGLVNGHDEKFINYINEQNKNKSLLNVKEITVKDLHKINANKLRRHLNTYYLNSYKDIRNVTVKKGFGNTEGFIVSADKQTAIAHNANLLIREYVSELEKPRKMRRNRMTIVNSVNQKMLHTYFSNYVDDFANKIIENDGNKYSEEAINYAKKYISHRDKIVELENRIRNNNTELVTLDAQNERERLNQKGKEIESNRKAKLSEYKKALNESTDEELLNRLSSEYFAIKDEVQQIVKDLQSLNDKEKKLVEEIYNADKERSDEQVRLFVTARNLTNEYSTDADYQMQNYGNLVEQALTNTNLWYFQVINSSMMSGIVKEFSNFSADEIEAELEETEGADILSQYAGEKVDELAKGWENHIYSNAEQSISVRMKMAIAMLPNLTSPINDSAERSYDRNNGLGVMTYLDPKTVLNQIHLNKNITNVQEFLKDLEEKTQTIPSMYGLGELVEQMKKDPEFANEVFVNFSKPIVHKLRVEVVGSPEGGTDIQVRYSNSDAFPKLEMFYRLRSSILFNGTKVYDSKQSVQLTNIQKRMADSLNKTGAINLTETDKSVISSILTSYVPTLTKEDIINILNRNNNGDNIRQLVAGLQEVIAGTGLLKGKIQSAEQAVYRKNIEANRLFADQRRLWENNIPYTDENGEKVVDENGNAVKPKRPAKEKVDYSQFEIEKRTEAGIFTLCEVLNKFGQAKIRLNSPNAEGNTNSNVMKNNWITRFFDRFENGQTGVQAFLEEITQGATDVDSENQYSHNPLFFGIQDENGNIIVPGMFTKIKNNDGTTSYIINGDVCYNMLKYSLFDGTANNITQDGKSYAKLSKNDFFLTNYFAFINSVDEISNGQKTKNIGKNNLNASKEDIRSAVYGTRIGSDAPKTFLIRAPRYTTNQCIHAIANHVLDEVILFTKGLNKVFLQENNFEAVKETGSLYRNLFYDEKTGKIVDNNGRLTGKIFKFLRLCDTETQLSDRFTSKEIDKRQASQRIEDMLNLYGNENSLFITTENGNIAINPIRLDNIMNGTDEYFNYNDETGTFSINFGGNIRKGLYNIVKDWSSNYLADVERNERTDKISLLLSIGKYDPESFREYILNTANMYMNYDDMFEGDYKFYKNSRDFLKRAKEIQAGGDGYTGYDVNTVDYNVHDLEDTPPIQVGKLSLTARNGFKALTVNSVTLSARYADDIQKILQRTLEKTMPKKQANKLATRIAAGHRQAIVVNDAQSYITIEEFIRRRYADGTLRKYRPLLEKLVDPDVKLEDINMDEVNEFLQVQKNFYYDKIYDSDLGIFVPRQIKNAEFVLIPKLLPENSPLRRVYDWMRANDIDQLNTTETTKAGNKNVFNLFDENGELIEDFDKIDENGNNANGLSSDMIEDFFYRNLYKQQDVKQHMQDETNKAGTQFMKRIIDNCVGHPELNDIARNFQRAYSRNIEESNEFFLNSMGWTINENGEIVNTDGNYATTDSNGNRLEDDEIEINKKTLNYSRFFERCREQAVMLGMDSNFIDYLNPNDFGQSKLPMWNNNVAIKMEQVVNSLANRTIGRQELPGFHCVQITDVGYDKTLNFNPESGIMEVRLPRTSKLLPQVNNEKEEKELIAKMESEGIDLFMAYRIPTEGKQSIARIKVVGFVNDALGSTIVVPSAWVRQTGSDFDVDAIYGFTWSLKKGVDKNGKRVIKKVPYRDQNVEGTEENPVDNKVLYRKYIEARINSKIDRVDYGQEREDRIKRIKDEYKKARKENVTLSKKYDTIYEIRRDLYRLLPPTIKRQLVELHGERRKKETESNTKTNMSDFHDKVIYPMIDNYLNDDRNEKTLEKIVQIPEDISKKIKDNLGEEYKEISMRNLITIYRELGMAIGDVLESVTDDSKEAKSNAIAESIRQLKAEIAEKDFNVVKKVAKEAQLISFEEFEQMDLIDRLDRDGRNNYILDCAMRIMEHEDSREEQYSRSNFDNIQNGINVVNALKEIDSSAQTPYDIMTQIDYFDDTQSGAELKGRSVTCDNTNSNNNKVRAFLNKLDGIKIVVDTDQEFLPIDARYSDEEGADNRIYDREGIQNSYVHDIEGVVENEQIGTNEYVKPKKGSIRLTLTQMGFSRDNRNLVGELITSYTSQTTSHFLDAVKTGSVPGVNLYTFNVYKLLSSVGLPHEFVIKFISQPAIQLLCSTQANNNSLFNQDSVDPIKGTIVRIMNSYSINAINKKGEEYVLDANASWQQIHQTLANYKDFSDEFYEMFGFKIKPYTDDMEHPPVNISKFVMELYEPALEQRITKSQQHYGYNMQEPCHDIAILLAFKHYYDIAERINKISLTTGIEKAGNAPQIFANRKTVDNVMDLLEEGTLRCEDGETYLSKLLPFKNRKKDKGQQIVNYKDLAREIDIESSSIPSYAAKFKYVLLNSIITNGPLIETENDAFYSHLLQFERNYGITLTLDKKQKLTSFAIRDLYNHMDILLSPIHVNEKGNIQTLTKEELEKYNKNDNFWNNERSRIFGFNMFTTGEINIKDVNNPTVEEIAQFEQLSPAQKVTFIQRNFDEAGVFKNLIVTDTQTYRTNKKGFYRQYISVNENADGIENMLYAFGQAFTSHNPLVKLAAIDLVKYEYIADGNVFKTGSLANIIHNAALYTHIEDGGMGLTQTMNANMNDFYAVKNGESAINGIDFALRFIKSHSNMARTFTLKKLPEKKYFAEEETWGRRANDANETTEFLKTINPIDKMSFINLNDCLNNRNLANLAQHLRLADAYGPKFINIVNEEDVPNSKDTRITKTLYYVHRILDVNEDNKYTVRYVALVPLNTLNVDEAYDVSYNTANNRFNDFGYYVPIITEIERKLLPFCYENIKSTLTSGLENDAIKHIAEPVFNQINIFYGDDAEDSKAIGKKFGAKSHEEKEITKTQKLQKAESIITNIDDDSTINEFLEIHPNSKNIYLYSEEDNKFHDIEGKIVKSFTIADNMYIGKLGKNEASLITTENIFRSILNGLYGGNTTLSYLKASDFKDEDVKTIFAKLTRENKPIGKPTSVYETELNPNESDNVINQLSHNINAKVSAVAQKLINDYREHLKNTQGEVGSEFIFYQPEVLNNYFEKDKNYNQKIEIAPGVYKDVTIRRIDMSKGNIAEEMAYYIKNGKFKYDNNRSDYWKKVAEQLKRQGTTEFITIRRADVYKIIDAPQSDNNKHELQQTINSDEETMNAETGTISTRERSTTDSTSEKEKEIELFDPFRRIIKNPVDRISCSILNEISYQARKGSMIGQRYENILHRRGLDRFATEEDVQENKAFIYQQAAKYYSIAASNLISRLNHFEIDGSTYALDNPELYTQLALHDEYFGEIAGLILDSITFGNRIDSVMGLDLAVESEEMKEAIEKIRDSILKMRNNDKVRKGLRLLMDIYMKKYSTNPLIMNDILEVGEQFGTLDWFSKYIMNPADVENQEVQIVLKKIFNIINKAQLFDAHDNVKEYEDRIAAIEAMNSENCDMSKIINDETGQVRQYYNEDYVTEKQRLHDEYERTRRLWEDDYKNSDKTRAYLKARYEFDKFIHDHEEQKLDKNYYSRDLALRKAVMDNAGETYVRYTQLIYELYNTDLEDETEDEYTQKKKRIRSEIAALKSSYLRGAGDVLVEKTDKELKEAKALSDFVKKRNELAQDYFDNTEYDGFWEQYKSYKDYIDWYDHENPHYTLNMKMQDDKYKEAYNWIQNNGSMQFDAETRKKMFEMYRTLKNEQSRVGKIAASEIEAANARDLGGIVDGRKLSDESVDRIRNEEQSNLSKMFDDEEEKILYGFQPQRDVIYEKGKERKRAKVDNERNKIVTKINDILMRAVDVSTNQFNMRLFFGLDNAGKPLENSPITNEDRITLIQLFNDLRETDTERAKMYKELGRYKKWKALKDTGTVATEFVPSTKVNYEMWNQHKAFATTELGLFIGDTSRTRSIQADQFKKIFMEIDPITHLYIPNQLLYNYYEVGENVEINKEKTEALHWLNDNVQTIKTQYYYDAIEEHQEKGDFEEWFKKNHIYNPYTHRYEPLSIWTTIAPTGDNEFAYIPSLENMEKTPKTDKLNKNYYKHRTNYIKGSDSKYNSNISLNSKETAMRDYIQETLEKYATTERGKQFVGKGYMPRERKAIHDMKWYGTQVANMAGLSYHSSGESDTFKQIIDYSHDRESDFDMLDLVKDQGSRNYLSYPARERMTAEQYGEEVKRIRNANREIEKQNLEIDKARRKNNWNDIMKDYIHNATIFNARQATKPYFYLLLEDLEQNKAYKLKGFWNKNLVPSAHEGYVMEDQTDVKQLVQNFARRIIREEFHEPNKLRTMANFLQNMASAKFMVFNLYGGINNVTIGLTGIAMEAFAGEYFDWKHFKEAQTQYLRHSTSYLSTAFTEKSPDLTTALIKQFKIVDIDEMLQFGAGSADLDTKLKNIRDALYSLQSMGEHYMQNTGFLAMCKSNRLYMDSKGIYRIGDFKDYSQQLSNNAMRDVLADIDEDLLKYYEDVYLKKTVKYDLELKKDIVTGRKDINRNFLNALKNSNENRFNSIYNTVQQRYYERMKELAKIARETFENEDHPTVESLFEYKNGRAEIKKQYIDLFDNLSDENKKVGDLKSLLADFKQKVIEVNHKIHGVYDKNQAAMMEKQWFGSLLMQYKKHLPWGIMKRWRRQGYWSEFRGGNERGVFQDWIDFMGAEFIDYDKMVKGKTQSGTNLALAHIQTAMECVVNMFHNWNFNKTSLAPWEVNNLNRLWGDIVGTLTPMVIATLLHGLWDDDEIKDDKFLSSLMYVLDRQYSEATMYTPFGLVSETKQGWSSPVAGASGPNDIWYMIENLPQYIVDSDFHKYKTGQYAGRDRMAVMIRRNLPGVRPYDRIRFITKYNKYYKVGESQIGLNAAIKLGDMLRDL